jgi:D-glycero-D-manno-heptose 1,7-bisphosphate phosphatase
MKAAFIDRDGVINKEVGYLHRIEDFEYTYNCVEGLKSLIDSGFFLIIVTNQAGIAKGLYSENDYERLMNWMTADLARYGIKFKDIFYCPHHPDGVVKKYTKICEFRKPSLGMFTLARDRYVIDMESSIVIGDKLSDVQAGKNAGVGRAFLVKSGHAINNSEHPECEVFQNLFEVSEILCN